MIVMALSTDGNQRYRPPCRSWRSTARTSAILLAEVPCDSSRMTRTRTSRVHDRTSDEPLDVYDYARPRARRSRRPMPDDSTSWTVTDDWPEAVPGTEAEVTPAPPRSARARP